MNAQDILPLDRIILAVRPVAPPGILSFLGLLASGLIVLMEMGHQLDCIVCDELALRPVAFKDMLTAKG